MFDYTDCNLASSVLSTPPSDVNNIGSWSFNSATSICTIRFNLKKTFKAPVFLYYRLTNFYQNHRRYIKSVSTDQLKGQAIEKSNLGDCSPLASNGDLVYYPCGLIANSMFSGKENVYFEIFIDDRATWSTDNIGASQTPLQNFSLKKIENNEAYIFSCKGIAWPSDAQKYGYTQYDLNQIIPPKDWKKYNNAALNGTWASSVVTFNPAIDEHFQVLNTVLK